MANRFDTVWGVFTKPFHDTKNIIRNMIAGKKIKEIEKGVNELYPKVQSRNGKLFKKIIEDMALMDKDLGDDNNEAYDRKMHLGYRRKELYILAAKWLINLYDFDRYYAERIDYVLYRILDVQDEIYLDKQSDPKNWYPNRPENSRYMFLRMQDKEKEDKQ